jgi:zinc transport system substrate-binding protein
MRLAWLAMLAASGMVLPAQAEVPAVVASIKPIHALVATAMGELGSPALIVDGAASPHTYSLKPSDAESLEGADLVFWTGHGLERFLAEAVPALAADATIVELSEVPGIELLPVREGGAFAAHDHHEDGHDHDGEAHDSHEEHEASHAHHHEHGEPDLHFWLDPQNAQVMLRVVAAALADADPENAAIYTANAEAGVAELEELEAEIAAALAPVADRRFIVFHDAYQYLERRFGLHSAGTITVSPDNMPGARRIGELRQHIAETGVTCVFAEPQFEPSIVTAIIEGSGARSGTLDPEAATLEPGPQLYSELLRGLAHNLIDCLSGS